MKLDSFARKAAPYLLAAAAVACTTTMLALSQSRLHRGVMGLVYILVVAVVAAAEGTFPAVFASFAAFFAWSFFITPPLYSLSFTGQDPDENVRLLVFLFVAILVGQIIGDVRRRESQALARERDASALYKAILTVGTRTNIRAALQATVEQVQENTGAVGSAIFTWPFTEALPEPAASTGDVRAAASGEGIRILQWAAERGLAVGLPPAPPSTARDGTAWPATASHREATGVASPRSDIFLPLTTGGRTLGILYTAPREGFPFSVSDCKLLVAFSLNGGAFLERRRLMEEAARAESQHEMEKMKSLLLSSISHNLKTPIASLNTTVSSLRREDVDWDRATLRDQCALMAEDIGRLTEHINNLLNLAHIESGAWKPHQEEHDFREIVSTAVESFPDSDYSRLTITVPDELPMIRVDAMQMSQVIHHLLENAIEYSTPGTAIELSAEADGEQFTFRVDDAGPGIAEEDGDKIFQRFYRGSAASERATRGTGLGLAICREILQAHGGSITVEKSPCGGARFTARIPLDRKEEDGEER